MLCMRQTLRIDKMEGMYVDFVFRAAYTPLFNSGL
ncbi:MAG: hypothetical protein XD78_2058 [Desulfotomaculum sp. 46_296]|nr:MAG: hypothetical protein XD78_2058 [Desulfotomaculum sp. 46_296]